MDNSAVSSLRIAHTVSSLNNLSAGPSYSVPRLAESQGKLGLDVSLHSLEGDPKFNGGFLKDIRYRRDFRSVPFLNRLGFSKAMKISLENGHYDIVHTHGVWLMANTFRCRKAALVMAPRGMLSSVALSFSPIKKNIFRRVWQADAFDSVRLFHATSQIEYEDIRAAGFIQPVAVIPNGIDIPTLKADHNHERPQKHVITLGRIHPKKGLINLLLAWSKLEGVFSDWQLEIIGPDEGGHRSFLESESRRLGLKRVAFFEAVYGSDKEHRFSTADLFILPSLSENFAMTVAESLVHQVPVIATRGTPWSGLLEHGCGWWTEADKDALAAALKAAMSLQASERQAMGERGCRWMEEQFSWERISRMSLEAYGWILGLGDRPDFVRLA